MKVSELLGERAGHGRFLPMRFSDKSTVEISRDPYLGSEADQSAGWYLSVHAGTETSRYSASKDRQDRNKRYRNDHGSLSRDAMVTTGTVAHKANNRPGFIRSASDLIPQDETRHVGRRPASAANKSRPDES